MKKLKNKLIYFTVSCLLSVRVTAFAADNISVVVNGNKVTFNDAQPIIYSDRTLIPVRAVFEKLDWFVDWDSANNMAVILNDKKVIFVAINSSTMEVYDVENDTQDKIILDVPAMIIDGSTMMPLRAVCESLGAEVQWDGFNQTVFIDN